MTTPARARAIAEYIALDSVEQEVRSTLLDYAAMLERCWIIQRHFAMTKNESEMLDYILHGNEEKEEV